MAAEDDDEGKEDVLALAEAAAVTAFPREDGGEAGEAGAGTDVEPPAPVETGDDRSGGRTAVEIALERPGIIAGETAEEALFPDGPVWTVRPVEPGIEAAQKLAAAERLERAAEALETARDGGTSGEWTAEEAVWEPAADAAFAGTRRAAETQAGLEGLYRQTVRAAQPAAPALPRSQTGRTAQAQEPGAAASLAVDELDRAVRRDSRRYDGGMSIF